MSPHRSRMTDKTLTSIVFLKCNAGGGGITNSALQKNKCGANCQLTICMMQLSEFSYFA